MERKIVAEAAAAATLEEAGALVTIWEMNSVLKTMAVIMLAP
jgi:hypothetical protein